LTAKYFHPSIHIDVDIFHDLANFISLKFTARRAEIVAELVFRSNVAVKVNRFVYDEPPQTSLYMQPPTRKAPADYKDLLTALLTAALDLRWAVFPQDCPPGVLTTLRTGLANIGNASTNVVVVPGGISKFTGKPIPFFFDSEPEEHATTIECLESVKHDIQQHRQQQFLNQHAIKWVHIIKKLQEVR
jgi:hypothetical protein